MPDTIHLAVQDGRADPLAAQPDPDLRFRDLAFHLFGEIESLLDKQIYPEQVAEGFHAPDDREYSVTLTAGDWRRYGQAMQALEMAQRREPR